MKGNLKGLLPVVIFFALLNLILLAGRSKLDGWGTDSGVLFIGNGLLFIITVISFFIAHKGVYHPNPNVFMRTIMGSIMLKMLLLIIVAFIYISVFKKDINKPALFILMGLYLVYTFLEVSGLMKMLKQK